MITVCRVKVEDTYPLRAKVLRNGGPPDMARVVGDDVGSCGQGEPDAGGGALGRR